MADPTVKIKDCPFCGSSAHYFYDGSLSPSKGHHEWAICDGCDAAEPVAVWNKRAPITAAEQRGKIAGLEEAAKVADAYQTRMESAAARLDNYHRPNTVALSKADAGESIAAAIRALAEKERGS